jgi:NAD(P)-dependent dehydrogenase (short-subunit alcohol dehydrogenase family)
MVEAVQGKTALITGAAGGIGREVARRLAQDGWNLALWDVRAEEVRTVAQELSRNGVRAWSEVVDVSSSPKVARAGKNLKDLGAVVHAAGLLSTSDLEACTDEEWQRVLDANLTSTFYVVSTVARLAGQSWTTGSAAPVAL